MAGLAGVETVSPIARARRFQIAWSSSQRSSGDDRAHRGRPPTARRSLRISRRPGATPRAPQCTCMLGRPAQVWTEACVIVPLGVENTYVMLSPTVARRSMSRDESGLNVLVLADRVEVALSACRALTRNGHVVGAATSTRTSPVLASRAVAHRHLFPGRSAQQEVWSSALRAAISQCSYDVVLACNDTDVVRLIDTRHSIASVPSMTAEQAVVLDKGALAKVCADVGVAYPRTYVPDTPSDDTVVAATVRDRAVVKAARPAVVTSRGIVHMAGMSAVSDPQAMVTAMERYRAAGLRPIVQEHVDGPKLQAAVIRRAGVTSCRMVALVERGMPAEATLRQLDSSAGLGADCIAALECVADRASYQGVLQAEFVATAYGGVCLIDLNPRLWGGLSFAELIGLRMTERVVNDAIGLPAPSMPAETVDRRYHHAARELAYLARSPRELPSILSQWSRGDLWDAPRFNDLRPHLVQCWQQARRSSRRRRPAGKQSSNGVGG